jgi:ribosomal protein L32
MPHRVCPDCGYYDSELIVVKKEKNKKKEEEPK